MIGGRFLWQPVPRAGKDRCRALDDITVFDAHQAIAPGTIFAMGPADDNPACPVEQVANQVVADGLREAEAAWLQYLKGRSLAEMAERVLREGGMTQAPSSITHEP